MTSKIKKYKEYTLFSDIFIGEYVELTTSLSLKTAIDAGEEGQIIQDGPVNVTGFLLDQDDTYYYLGEGPSAMDTAVKIDAVKAITIVKQKTIFDEILDEMPNPENDEEFN